MYVILVPKCLGSEVSVHWVKIRTGFGFGLGLGGTVSNSHSAVSFGILLFRIPHAKFPHINPHT